MGDSIYYFAYGSNMNREQMLTRCPSSTKIGIACLLDHKIAFTRFSAKRESAVADILVSPGDEVWGILYKITQNDLAELDKKEGAPNIYRRVSLVVKQLRGAPSFEGIDKSFDFKDLGYHSTVGINDIHMSNSTEIEAEVYEVVNKQFGISPSMKYLGLIQDAAFENLFPLRYQKELNKHAESILIQKRAAALDYFCMLQDMIVNNQWPEAAPKFDEWGGANLVITKSSKRKSELNSSYPQDIVVLTPFSNCLSWLVSDIYNNENLSWQIDAGNKHTLLSEIGAAANEYQESFPNDNKIEGIALAIVYRAYSILTSF